MTPKRRRGPFMVYDGPPPEDGQIRILIPEMLGRIIAIAREGVGATQRDIGRHLDMPPSTIGKLERGDVSMCVHHLDAFADAFCHFGSELQGTYAVQWTGWEFHRITSQIIAVLRAEGYYPVWQRTQDVEGDYYDGARYLRGKALMALIRKAWPADARNRM